ncbi:YifB family Mg chelatase-like AAA ATPase [Compostimonas suwonensis]|uniref:Magnesium chelatase family protein n=1 Tax=Compostimonas suwonensis TaxID=1048394 RepID=A0A2M9BZT6_9MICO|nr:YifB family Mg chelatase-like AAA ATPase [Compostimonas suwonensis]PJJ63593.1 magnesium chelatase family protein [Compostimonas suwonensis]
MSLGRTLSVALVGMTGFVVEVEADLSSNLPGFTLIGLPDTSLSESRERVRAAAKNSGCDLPGRKITVNLSPAALPKYGSGFDLSIALASLAAAGTVSAESVARVVHLGELGLDGRLRPVPGILPAVVAASRAGVATIMVPSANADEASLVQGIRVVPVASLLEAVIWHGGEFEPVPVEPVRLETVRDDGAQPLELADVVGNDDAVEALLAAAAGGHHVSMIGPPGAGKTMLAARLPGILPDLGEQQALEVTILRSLAGGAVGSALVVRPPWESPHHTATAAAMVGGGSGRIRPGAAARASHGVLFLDEAPEFQPAVLDCLRQPLESGTITIDRANATARFPGSFQLVLAANPCPCGQYGSPDSECSCAPMSRRRYFGRISGPLLDRIDIHLQLRRISATQLRVSTEQARLTTLDARARVRTARDQAAERLASTPWSLNSQVPGPWLRGRQMVLPPGTTTALDRALERGALTMRGYDRVLKVAWTLSDLDGAQRPGGDHIGRALYLRKGIAP